MIYVLYGLEEGEERRYMETLLGEYRDERTAKVAKDLAGKRGWHGLRIAKYSESFEFPDFTQAINIKR